MPRLYDREVTITLTKREEKQLRKTLVFLAQKRALGLVVGYGITEVIGARIIDTLDGKEKV